MPAATFNRDRATGQQHPASRSQIYQDMMEGDSNATRQAHDLAQQYNQDIFNGVSHSTPSLETFMMSMALEQEHDLGSFSQASGGNPQSSIASALNCDPSSTQAGQQGSVNISQTQLLSGSRS